MRILHISSARSFGGGERHVVDLTRALAVRGHEVYAALASASPLFEKLSHLPASNVIAVPLRNALDLPSARALLKFIRERQIEIVHAHVARDYPLAAYAAARLAGRAQLVITRHVPFALSKLHRLILADVSRVIAVSEPIARQLGARGIFPVEKIRTIPNGIDLPRFDFSETGFDREGYRRELPSAASMLVGIVGELSAVKGQEDFVSIASRIVRRRHDVDFIIAGEDRSVGRPTRGRLERLIAKHGLQERIHLLGRVAEAGPLLASLDVLVSASHAEAFGLAMAEAMACGVPVVATATDGARAIIEDGVTGRLVPIGDAEALERAVTDLLDDPELRGRFGACGRERVRERFSLERMVKATEAVYREALTGVRI